MLKLAALGFVVIALQTPPIGLAEGVHGQDNATARKTSPSPQSANPLPPAAPTDVVGAAVSPPSQPHSTPPKTDGKTDTPNENGLTYATWGLVLFTAALVGVSLLQWRALGLHAQHFKDLAEATLTAAHAASSSARTARVALTNLNRAYLITEEWSAMHTHRNQPIVFEISGRIEYRDLFSTRYRRFARTGIYGSNRNSQFALPASVGANDEEDWGQSMAHPDQNDAKSKG